MQSFLSIVRFYWSIEINGTVRVRADHTPHIDHVGQLQKARAAEASANHRKSLHRRATEIAQPEPSARPLGLPCKPPRDATAATPPPRHAAPITGKEA